MQPIDETLSGTNITSQIEPQGHINEGVLHTTQVSRTGPYPWDAVYCHTKDTFLGFGLVEFYGISTIIGYLLPNPLYTYILNI